MTLLKLFSQELGCTALTGPGFLYTLKAPTNKRSESDIPLVAPNKVMLPTG